MLQLLAVLPSSESRISLKRSAERELVHKNLASKQSNAIPGIAARYSHKYSVAATRLLSNKLRSLGLRRCRIFGIPFTG
jgi:hypothetical protein